MTLLLAGLFLKSRAGAIRPDVCHRRFSGSADCAGLNVVAGAVGNAFVAKNVNKMREGVERGESLLRTATATGMFSPLVLQMISVGEETARWTSCCRRR